MVYRDFAFLPSPPRGVWFIGGLPLRAYAGFILLGIIIAIVWSNKRWLIRGGSAGQVESVALIAVPCGIIGGRMYHVLTDWDTYFRGPLSPIDVFKIWDGGLGIWGAVILGGFGAAYACRKQNIPLASFADAVAPPIALAQAIGRLGNYFNQELFGRATTLPWGLIIYQRSDGNNVGYDVINGVSTGEIYSIVQPTFLYELLWNLIVVGILLFAERRLGFVFGQLFTLYVASYCFGRFFIELLRDDPATHVYGLRINTITSSVLYFSAVIWLIYSRHNTITIDTLYDVIDDGKDKDTSELHADKKFTDNRSSDENFNAQENQEPVEDFDDLQVIFEFEAVEIVDNPELGEGIDFFEEDSIRKSTTPHDSYISEYSDTDSFSNLSYDNTSITKFTDDTNNGTLTRAAETGFPQLQVISEQIIREEIPPRQLMTPDPVADEEDSDHIHPPTSSTDIVPRPPIFPDQVTQSEGLVADGLRKLGENEKR